MLYFAAAAYVVVGLIIWFDPSFTLHPIVIGFMMLVLALKTCLIQYLAETCDGQHPEMLEEEDDDDDR